VRRDEAVVLASMAVQASAKAQINLQRTVFAMEGLGVDDLASFDGSVRAGQWRRCGPQLVRVAGRGGEQQGHAKGSGRDSEPSEGGAFHLNLRRGNP
jgi:hypothetical protein